MSLDDNTITRVAHDGYQAYYAEKIWRLIPGIYRARDGGSLRGLVEVLADAAADERRSVDRLWADASIVDCDDWVIPYIAEMLGTRLVSEQNTAGRRTDVASTIKFRRFAGTVHLLAMLAEDIAGWDAVASEAFKRLARNWHLLDCPPNIGPVSGTPQHGFARMSRFRVGDIVDDAFDDLAHFPDFRRHRGVAGRYNVPKVNLHLYRQNAYLLQGVTPYDLGGARWTLDPSGRDIVLFQPGQPYTDACKSGAEWEVRRPLTCALFNDGRYRVTPAVAGAGVGSDLLTLDGATFRTASSFLNRAAAIKEAALTPAEGRDLLETALLPESNRANLFGDALSLGSGVAQTPFRVGELFAADLDTWDGIAAATPWIQALVDPASGRVRSGGRLASLRYYEGRFTPIGAGSHDRQADLTAEAPAALGGAGAVAGFTFPTSGAHQINDSLTYAYALDTDLTLTGNLHVQAANNVRPFIRIPATAVAPAIPRWVIDADEVGRDLTLDGLWLNMIRAADPDAEGTAPALSEIVLQGGFNRVCLRNMTLDPGGERAELPAPIGRRAIPTVRLVIAGASDLIEIDRCVTGPIEEALGATTQCAAGILRITDSVVRAGQEFDGEALPAFRGRHATLEVQRSTLLGHVEAARYAISDSIIQGTVSAQDPQGSCIRYSAAVETAAIGLAGAYRCETFADVLPNHYFVSRDFGHAGLAQLSQTAPETIRRGAENTAEMGAHNRTLDAIKRDDLIYKLQEFTAINTITQLVFET